MAQLGERMKTSVALIAAMGLAASTGVAALAPAQGESARALTATFRDGDEARSGPTDIRVVRVDNRERKVHIWVKEARRKHFATKVYIDSVRSDTGPEYLISGYQNSEFIAYRVEGFKDQSDHVWQCSGVRMADDGTSRWVHYSFRSDCARGAGGIRVHAASKGRLRGTGDVAPDNSSTGHKRFYAWVARG